MYISQDEYTKMLNKIKQLTHLNQTYHSDNTKLGQQIIRQRNLMKKITYQNSKRNTTYSDDTPSTNKQQCIKQDFVREMKKIEENLLRQIQKKNQQQKKFIQTQIQKSRSLDNVSHGSVCNKQVRPYPQRLLGFIKQIKEKDSQGKKLEAKQIIKLAYKQKILENSENNEEMDKDDQQQKKKRKKVPLSADKNDKLKHADKKEQETPLKPKYDQPTQKKIKEKDDQKSKKKKAKQPHQAKPDKPLKSKNKSDKPTTDDKQKKKRQEILNLLPDGLKALGIR